MALPSGYKRLEYIQSTGTQFIDTGFKPNQNTRCDLDATFLDSDSTTSALFGARNGSNQQFWIFWQIPNFYARYNKVNIQVTASHSDRHTFSLNKNVFSVDGNQSKVTAATFQSPYDAFLFAINNAGSVNYKASAKLYSCQIYDNGILIRDYIPCQTTAGEIGLWDDVNSVFNGNAGTGTFTAGPVVAVIPDAPSNLQQTMSVLLAWASVSDAERYNIYRDGTLIASTTDLFYVDDTAAENTEYTYGVSAVNSAGESPKTTIPIYTKSGYFLYKPYLESATFQ